MSSLSNSHSDKQQSLLLSCFLVLVRWPEHCHAFCDAWLNKSHLMMAKIREQKIFHSSLEVVVAFKGTKSLFWFTLPSWQSLGRVGSHMAGAGWGQEWKWAVVGEVQEPFIFYFFSKSCQSSPGFSFLSFFFPFFLSSFLYLFIYLFLVYFPWVRHLILC